MFWYEDEVIRVVQERNACQYLPKTIFYGSSTIRLWNTLNRDFKEKYPINLGFGGSTLAACVWFFERIVAPLQTPEQLIIYAGDNDLGDGRHPEEVFIFYQQLIHKIKERFHNIPCGYVSIKPSLSRWNILDRIKHANALIKTDIEKQGNGMYYINIFDKMLDKHGYPLRSLYEYDGLHLSHKGYDIWRETILSHPSFKK